MHQALTASVMWLPRGQKAGHAVQRLHGNPGDPDDSCESKYDVQPIKRKEVKRLSGSRIT
ncbi:hypothetical protein B9R14_04175 [Acetivibrio saccincola]|uniref:Uncharacterized protein n=1 Tax=Acetivibrio saccincola TaxID=1677857 RepID=A0A2S8R8B2_9FIRM|nr:hypothetical protein B9R14_04175 [Acetivibrio saccincola]